MGFQEKLYALRVEHGLSQRELGKRLNVSSVTIGKWEQGKTQPSLGHLIQMSDLFHESLDALADRKILYAMSQEDRRILTFLERYKKLDQYGRRAVDAVCAVELDRIQEMNLRKEAPKREWEYIPLYAYPSAAGIAAPLEGSDFEMIPADTAPEAADFAVRIDGDSMAPYIQDGETVFLQAGTELEIGDVGIFSVNGEMYCKQYLVDEARNLHLKSANPERRNMDVYVPADSGDTVEVVGKVLGVRVPV